LFYYNGSPKSEYFFAAINDEKMELNSIRNVMETELVKSISIRENWFFIMGYSAKSYSHVGRNKRVVLS
jgi:hypothetical protein